MNTFAPATAIAVSDTLESVGELIGDYLSDRLGRHGPSQWLWDLAADYPARGGKAIRPALCLATCRAFGGTTDESLVSAAAIELLHNAFLVHDDIEDESEQRRGSPTLHASVGVPLALNAGDAMVLEAMSMLRENRTRLGSRLANRVTTEFEEMLRHTVDGQATELGWQRDGVIDVGPTDYLELVLRKTSWYTTIHPLRVGALVGGWGRAPLERMVHFGTYLGAAFQIRDDLLNLIGDERVYGKEILGDLYEGKRTLMLIHLWRHIDERDRREVLMPYLDASRQQRSDSQVREVLRLMHHVGSIDYASEFAAGIAARAVTAFDHAFEDALPSPDRTFVRNLIDFMLNRDQ